VSGSGTGTPVTVPGFCTLADVQNFLQLTISEAIQVAAVNRAIAEATEAIKNYCHQEISLVADDPITLDVLLAGNKIFLPELPAVSVASVVEDGETLVVDDDYVLGQHGILYRVDDEWLAGIQIVTITYTHGYDVIPDDIVAACTRMAARAYQAGLKAAELAGLAGVQSLHLGDYTVAFGGEAGGADAGVLGASAARMLLLSEKDILARYRYVQL